MTYKYNAFTGNLDLVSVEDLSGLVPYTGATQDVDLGLFDMTLTDITINGNIIFDSQTLSSISTGVGDNDKLVTQGYVDDAITAEDFWQRTGTDIHPQNAGDTITADGGLTIGTGAAVDYVLTFDGSSNDGTLTWDESLGRFLFDNTLRVVGPSYTTFLSDGAYGLNTTGGILVGADADIQGNVSIGNFGAGVDYTLTFNGETNTGTITWMEDENYFTFNKDVTVPDEVYGAGWNGSLEVPTKNAIYDKIETIAADITSVGDVSSGAAFDGTQGTILTFYNVGGNATFDYDGTDFTSSVDVTVPDEVYGVGWNGSLEVPTKNAVYDKIETLGGGANLALSNLAAVAINTSLLPGSDNNISLGSSTLGVTSLFLSDANVSSPATNGEIRYNNSTTQFEFYQNGGVATLGGSSNWTDVGAYLKPNTDGDGIRMYDGTATDYIELLHDGTDANINWNAGNLLAEHATSNSVVKFLGAGGSSTSRLFLGTATNPNFDLILANDNSSAFLALGSTCTEFAINESGRDCNIRMESDTITDAFLLDAEFGTISYGASNITFLSINDDIDTAVANATAGDTIVLAAGTYTITDDIDITKSITIQGQGPERTKIVVTNPVAFFRPLHITSSDVTVKDLSISVSSNLAAGVTIAWIDGQGGDLSNVLFENLDLDITLTNQAAYRSPIYVWDTSMDFKHVRLTTSNNYGDYALRISSEATASQDMDINLYDCEITISGGTQTNNAIFAREVGSFGVNLNTYDCNFKAFNGDANTTAIRVQGAGTTHIGRRCYYDGDGFDVLQQTSAVLTLDNCSLENGTTSGTITYAGQNRVGGLNINGAYTFPTSDGSANQVLQTNGTGTLSFATVGADDAVKKSINQTTHGFAVGDVVYLNGANYAKALADDAVSGEAVGIVSAVAGVDDFTLTTDGYITGLSSLTAGTVYWLSADTAGALTSTEPTDASTVSKPMLIADGTTSGWVLQMRGKVNSAADSVAAGQTVQVVNTQTGALDTGTTVTPGDDTIPQITEGDEYMTLAITPTSATNKLKIDVVVNGQSGSNGNSVIALHQDSTANALAAVYENTGTGESNPLSFTHFMDAGTTSSTTFRVRAGCTGAATYTFNGAASARLLGGVMASSITITEIQA
jgi:hypothetical protein